MSKTQDRQTFTDWWQASPDHRKYYEEMSINTKVILHDGAEREHVQVQTDNAVLSASDKGAAL